MLIDCRSSFKRSLLALYLDWMKFLNRNHPHSTIAGGRVSRFDADSAGLNSAWRNAVVQPLCGILWEDSHPHRRFKGRSPSFKTWYDLAPKDGAYFNEVCPVLLTRRPFLLASLKPYRDLCSRSTGRKPFFWLALIEAEAIKDKYDPHRLFVVAEGVGSEDWNKNSTCRY